MKTATIILFFCGLFLISNHAYAQNGSLIEGSFNHENQTRAYSVYVPENYQADTQWPLILNFHGYSGDVPDHIARTQMHGLADQHGLLIAYPVGLTITRDPNILPSFTPASGTGWSVPGFSNERDEIVYVDSLLNHLSREYSIDELRIHATGLSLGGYMAAYIGTQMSDRIASFASVAGHLTQDVRDLLSDDTQISVMMVHGTDDIITDYDGLNNEYLSVEDAASIFATNNKCETGPVETELEDIDSGDKTTVTMVAYSDCDLDLSVNVYRVNGGGHRWPGSGITEPAVLGNNSLDINTSQLIVDFFLDHTKSDSPSFYQRKDEWQTIVDETWGNSIPLDEKQRIFNEYADYADEYFTLFGHSEFDWETLRSRYYERITQDLSDGAYAGLMSHFSTEFKDLHARFWDRFVQATPAKHGTPIYYYNTFDVSHFGATLALQSDSTLLVIKTPEDHPLGLLPGDRIVGYEGIPWTQLTKELFEAELPGGGYLASDPESIQNFLMTNAGNNWHLFNSIDVIKYGQDTSVNLSLEPMFSTVPDGLIFTSEIFNNPQLPVAGIRQPIQNEEGVTYGIIDTDNLNFKTTVTKKVGYIYVTAHNYNEVEAEFLEAVEYVMSKQTDALIIDLRWNTGGYINPTNGLAKLFNAPANEVLGVLEKKVRCASGGLTDICDPGGDNMPVPGWFDWKPDPNSYYEGKIAVLIGPETQSMGEYFAYQLAEHPMAQTFGRPTNGAFSGNTQSGVTLGERWSANMVNYHLVETSNPDIPLTRKALVPDIEVWMNQDDVRKEIDTTVDEALAWIEDVSNSNEEIALSPSGLDLHQNYPNPFNPSTQITFEIPQSGFVQLKVYNVVGQEVATLIESGLTAGQHTVTFDAGNLSSGMYIYLLETGNQSISKKMLIIK